MQRALVRLCQQHGVCTRSVSYEATSLLQEPALQLSPEVVAFVTSRGQGTVAMPVELTQALEKAIARREGPHKALKKASTNLLDGLRGRSRTRGKGGSRLMPHKEAEQKLLEEPSRSELKHMLKKLVAAGPMPADRLDMAADQVHATSDSRKRVQQHQEPAVAYDDLATAAYATSRMPACYAVIKRIMEEVAFSQPAWRPRTMLDFGAGPATAAWAAAEVWDGAPRLEVQAVEQSSAMAELGHETGQELSADWPAIRWSSSLPGLSRPSHRMTKGKQEQMRNRLTRRHDLVTACYVLSEIEDAAQRRRVVECLWQTTGDTLLIAEPGTPIGSAIIREARWQILKMDGGGHAHVQAPCPHDGVCPMDGSRSWCHFRQRFQRPALQRRFRRPTNNTAPRSYQDERFSYVVLKRGPRPQPVEAAISSMSLHASSRADQVAAGSLPDSSSLQQQDVLAPQEEEGLQM
ncbi:hypothetical protein WJX84_003255 [Apatococcus fuscideae]|uniref:Uncharacterized protein n=1 Tax=Apatococcus fuscideae TaxID=2026836 RepID=A0AAW1T1R7_9CHLO